MIEFHTVPSVCVLWTEVVNWKTIWQTFYTEIHLKLLNMPHPNVGYSIHLNFLLPWLFTSIASSDKKSCELYEAFPVSSTPIYVGLCTECFLINSMLRWLIESTTRVTEMFYSIKFKNQKVGLMINIKLLFSWHSTSMPPTDRKKMFWVVRQHRDLLESW